MYVLGTTDLCNFLPVVYNNPFEIVVISIHNVSTNVSLSTAKFEVKYGANKMTTEYKRRCVSVVTRTGLVVGRTQENHTNSNCPYALDYRLRLNH